MFWSNAYPRCLCRFQEAFEGRTCQGRDVKADFQPSGELRLVICFCSPWSLLLKVVTICKSISLAVELFLLGT